MGKQIYKEHYMPKPVKSPGTVFKSFLDAYQLTPAKVAEDIKLSQSSVRLLINSKLRISIPFALRLAKYFGTKPEFWVELQNAYELSETAKNPKEAKIVKAIPKAKKPAPGSKKPAAKKAAAKKVGAKRVTAKKAAARKAGARKPAGAAKRNVRTAKSTVW
jgi:addiction module HigA family antidote